MDTSAVELHDIMGGLSDIAFSMDSLCEVLVSLEEAYDMTYDHTTQKVVHIIGLLLASMSEDLSDKIDEIDHFIIDNKTA